MEIEFVRAAVDLADLLALRTALYQATHEEVLLHLAFKGEHVKGTAQAFTEPAAQILKDRAVKFLTEELATFVPKTPTERELRHLMELTLGLPLDDSEFDLHRHSPGFDEFPREARWTAEPRGVTAGFTVAIIGAGISGITMAVQLKRLGIPFVIYERRAELGGTWSINTYPDARVDTASATYELRFVKNYPWTEYFAKQPEVRSYLEHVATAHGVLEHIRFGHDVTFAAFDDVESRWNLTIAHPDGTTTMSNPKIVVSASGLFATPKPLDIHGADSFEGEILHTTEWTSDHSAAGKSVAVIGNGSTGVQLLGRVASAAKHVYTFQRTPQWISPRARYGEPVEAEMRWLLDTMPYYWNWSRVTPLIPAFDTYDLLVPDPDWQRRGGYFNEQNDAVRAAFVAYIEQQTGGDRSLIDRLVPDYPPIARRLIVDNKWYQTLTHDHVDLVTDPITQIEADGIVTAAGNHYKVDLILAAVGFSVTKYLWPTEYRGRGGLELERVWSMDHGGPRAYAGVTVAGFPNMFILYGPNSQPTNGGLMLPAWIEIWVAYIAKSIIMMIEEGHDQMEITERAFDAYNAALDERASSMIWADPGSIKQNYYVNEAGRLQVGNPWKGVEYHAYLREPRSADYTFR